MKIEEQVTNLELSQKLKELRVKQDSYFKYEVREHGNVEIYHSKATSCAHKYYSAFTSAELGELLPAYTNINGDDCRLSMDKYYRPGTERQEFSCEYWVLGQNHYQLGKGVYGLNEANLRAEMLIYLIENNLWKPE